MADWSSFLQHLSKSPTAKHSAFLAKDSVSTPRFSNSSSSVCLASPVQPRAAGRNPRETVLLAASVAAPFGLPVLQTPAEEQQACSRPKLSSSLRPLVLKTMTLRSVPHHSGVKKSLKKILRVSNERGLRAGLRLGAAYCDKLVERDLHQPSLLPCGVEATKTTPIPNLGCRFLGGAKPSTCGLSRFAATPAPAAFGAAQSIDLPSASIVVPQPAVSSETAAVPVACLDNAAAVTSQVAAAACSTDPAVPAAPVVCCTSLPSKQVVSAAPGASRGPVASRTRSKTQGVAGRTRSKCRRF